MTQNGDLDRESYLIEVKNGKQEVVATLPPLNPIAVNKPAAAAAKPAAPAKK